MWLSIIIHLYVGRRRSSLATAASTLDVGETSSPRPPPQRWTPPEHPRHGRLLQHRTQMDDSICWPPSATGRDSIWWNPPLADDFLHPWPTSSFSTHVVGLLPRHGHLINAGRRRGTLAMGASSKPDADGRLDLLPPLATGRDSIWWNLPLADEPPPLTDDFLLPLPILGS
jgi:hypothetical protein